MKNKIRILPLIIVTFLVKAKLYAFNSDSSIFRANRLLARTINIGYTIEFENTAGVKDSLLKQISEIKKKMVFVLSAVYKLEVRHGLTSKARSVQGSFLTLIDQVIAIALDRHLAVILDNHSDEPLMNNPAIYGIRILALWSQLADHYKKYPDSLMFELMAEPHGNLNAYWNPLIHELLKKVRVNNPHRPVIVGPVNFNRPDFLNQLQLPADDRYIIVSFHQYNPVKFTMQGETWFPFGKPLEWLGTVWPQKGDEEYLAGLFNGIDTWAKANHRPVFLGEFGVSSMADTASAVRWIRFNRSEAEKRGFTWGFWSCFGIEFSLFNAKTQSWNSRFVDALMVSN